MSKARIAVSLIAATALVALAIACGSSANPQACIVIDASKSTRYALFDYEEQFESSLKEAADAGGSVAVVIATGRPLVESSVEREDFSGLTNADQEGDRIAAMEDLEWRVERSTQLASVGDPEPGSGIIAAIALIAGQGCAAIEVLSDGLEASDVHMKLDPITTTAGRNHLLDRLDERGLLSDLDGIELRFPFGGYVPQGTEISQARLDALPVFWDAYGARTGATLSWER